MSNDEVHELLALLAVDALNDDERREAEAMIQGRPELRRELDELRATLGSLAEIERHDPPERLRASVLDEVARTTQDAAEAAPAGRSETPVSSRASDRPIVAPVVAIESRRRRSAWTWAAAAAAVVALGAAAVFVGRSDDDGTDEQIAAVIEDPSAETIPMTGELEGLSIIYSADKGAAVLTGTDLPVPADDRVYELWAVRGEAAPQRVDVFRPDDDGAVEVLLLGIDPASATWAVTEEPAGGSDAPTTPIIASTA